MHVNRLSALLVAGLSLPLLSGCSASNAASGIELLEQPATKADALPSGSNATGFKPGTARFAARAEGHSFYVALPANEEDTESMPARPGVCIIVAEDDFTGCGGMPVNAMGISFGTVQLVPDRFDASTLTSAGWKQLHRNVFVKGLKPIPSPEPSP
ncbi:hypothetical protein GCM10009596_18270 [Arthrobacter rhombi]|uniref:hypothetical protein n=1 Tax=Arthrobacter rhombi TaxID=71253 RepID=UPI0031CE9017